VIGADVAYRGEAMSAYFTGTVRSTTPFSDSPLPTGTRHAVDEVGKAACGAGHLTPFSDRPWGIGPTRPDLCPYCLVLVAWSPGG
jgi:hypothetical protein